MLDKIFRAVGTAVATYVVLKYAILSGLQIGGFVILVAVLMLLSDITEPPKQ